MAVSGTGQSETPEFLVTPAFAGFPPIAESGIKAALTTGMTTDRKIFDFLPRRDIMVEIEYPGIAKLVSRLVWDQETVRSSRTTRTKTPLKSLISEGFSYSLFIAAQNLIGIIKLTVDLLYISSFLKGQLITFAFIFCRAMLKTLQKERIIY